MTEKEIRKQLFQLNVSSKTYEIDFNCLALEVFKFQYLNNIVYQGYVKQLKIVPEKINHYTEIPFLPIEFFKSKNVVCQSITTNTVCFSSSGTTGQITSKHYVNDVTMYEASFIKGFELFYGNPKDYCILALLPNYLERTGSSLVYMFDKLIKMSEHPKSGFYLNNLEDLITTIEHLKAKNQKTLLLGVTYALLDLADKKVDLSNDFFVMETGGMKGRRKEMIKDELHLLLKTNLNVKAIHSEYGMTELLSQAYSKSNGIFECPPWMKILIRDTNDPFYYQSNNKNGGVNVIDLANLYSCSFIETKDLGRKENDNTFEIIGRFDNSDLRGCNLMIQ